jgi:hypothetical protein
MHYDRMALLEGLLLVTRSDPNCSNRRTGSF